MKKPLFVLPLVIFIALQLFCVLAPAQIPVGYESYHSRPSILNVLPEALPASEDWEKLKQAHLTMIAELLEVYPKDTHLYFLARDSEHLYDVAKLVTQDTSDSSRIHLLNVSRGNMRAANAKEYLGENGLSEKTLGQGKKVVFIDTGFAGTIPRVISEYFPQELRAQLKTHLIVSSNPSIPSSRSFLVHLNPMAIEMAVTSLHGTILSYEFMPRYTDRSSQYTWHQNQWHPISPIKPTGDDGEVSKQKSLSYMKDIRAEWEKPQVRQRFQETRITYRNLVAHFQRGDQSSREAILQELQKRKGTSGEFLFEAQLRDLIELGEKSPEYGFRFQLGDFNLNVQKPHNYTQKHALMDKYPDWKPYLENPTTEIPKLFAEKNWQMISNLMDANIDAEINSVLFKHLFQTNGSAEKKKFQVDLLEGSSRHQVGTLLSEVFYSHPAPAEFQDSIRSIILRNDPWLLQQLVKFVFQKPASAGMTEELRLILERADEAVLRMLESYSVLKKNESLPPALDTLRASISIEDLNQRRAFLQHSFGKHSSSMPFDLESTLVRVRCNQIRR